MTHLCLCVCVCAERLGLGAGHLCMSNAFHKAMRIAPTLAPPLASVRVPCRGGGGSEAKRQACLCAATARSCLFRREVDEVNCESVSAPFEM